ncbi:hypothetical protein GOODEAATRI_024807 [Goodea atripinnis]|uniref:Secreted protein n=1 Tax=Goodea atripinnis TaxID=208336 RepID=A0ABV0NDC1_9TELE
MVNPVGRRKPLIPCELCSLAVLSSFHVFAHFSCKFAICCFLCFSGKSLVAAYKNRFSRRTWISQGFWPNKKLLLPQLLPACPVSNLLNLALNPVSYLSVHHNGKDMYHLR